jgi:hypothetical protein
VDSSLLDEWDKLVTGGDGAPDATVRPPIDAPVRPLTGNERAFRVLVRNALFRRVELAARRNWTALGELDAGSGWDADAWEQALSAYWDEHAAIRTDADARGPDLLVLDTSSEPGVWHVRQILHDPLGHHDWVIRVSVPLAASDEAGEAVIRILDVGLV